MRNKKKKTNKRSYRLYQQVLLRHLHIRVTGLAYLKLILCNSKIKLFCTTFLTPNPSYTSTLYTLCVTEIVQDLQREIFLGNAIGKNVQSAMHF